MGFLQQEISLSSLDADEVFSKLSSRWDVMVKSALQGCASPNLKSGFIQGVAHTQNTYAATGGLMGTMMNTVVARALSCSEVNAAMGRICAAPTAGACGVLPAVLLTVSEQRNVDHLTLLRALLTASGIGTIIVTNATVSGAEAGCQAECGAAGAMAAAAVVEMVGGTPEQSVNAVAFVLMNCMGLVCDPVAGLVQVPCAQRNASQAIGALVAADMALGGMNSLIPADEVLEAMLQTGKLLPTQLRETALGGLAATPTAKHLASLSFQKSGADAFRKA
jgi:L-serine dehydratase